MDNSPNTVGSSGQTPRLLTAELGSGSMAIASDRILEKRMDDRPGEVVRSGSRAQPSSSSKRSWDPSPDGSFCGRLPAVWGRGLAVHKTPPRRQQERDRQSRRHASLCPSGSTAAQAASRVDVSLGRTRSTYFCPNSPRSQGTAPLNRTGIRLQPGHPGAPLAQASFAAHTAEHFANRRKTGPVLAQPPDR